MFTVLKSLPLTVLKRPHRHDDLRAVGLEGDASGAVLCAAVRGCAREGGVV